MYEFASVVLAFVGSFCDARLGPGSPGENEPQPVNGFDQGCRIDAEDRRGEPPKAVWNDWTGMSAFGADNPQIPLKEAVRVARAKTQGTPCEQADRGIARAKKRLSTKAVVARAHEQKKV